MKDLVIHKYIVVGVSTIAIDYSMIFLVYSILNMNYILAIVTGFLLSSLFQFYANFFYTFSLLKNDDYYFRIILFCISAFVAIILGTGTVILLETYFHSLYLSKTLSLSVSFLYGYTASKYIIFNKNFIKKNNANNIEKINECKKII